MDRSAILERIKGWGSAFTPAVIGDTLAMFAPLVDRPDEATVLRDQAYGEDPRHRLDIFRTGAAGDKRPVLLFVHGGGFVMGDKGGPDAPFHNNIGAWAAKSGLVAATMSYRLAPAHGWPAGGEDVCRAVRWIAANIAEHGGDPDRIFIMGQSAGATHVADAVVMGDAPIAGALMISGLYDIGRAERNQFQAAYFGAEEQHFPARSTLPRLAASEIPCFYSVSEYDPEDFQRQAAWMVEAWVQQRARWPEMHWLAGHNHLSSVSQVGSPHDDLGPMIQDFIARVGASR
ncbi:MAG: alpha/beta hydrolase fold family protein [Sphingomonas bacterium]|nr:alpha/beta hydrolase fold family protein [Sphingomonas bacterium]